MKITILGPAYPYRGGLAAILQSVAREFASRNDEVDIKTFSLQYPSLLFPGTTQFVDQNEVAKPEDIAIERCVNTMNPFNWIAVGLRIKREKPDVLLLKYWTPFMAPALGTIARIARSNGHTKVICHIDNVDPHERHLTDRLFNYYFLRSVDGFVYMSEQVHSELRQYNKKARSIFSPHPMFDNFGDRVERTAACCDLSLDPSQKYALFFGLIRDYKGLDILLDAWAELKKEGKLPSRKLIVAGEFYTSKTKYLEQIEALGLGDDILLHDHFIADPDVANYFSISDFVVLPYHTASQSGVTQIAYNFSLPMVVTNVGGLPEIVPNDKVGYTCDPTVEGVAQAIAKMWADAETLERFKVNIKEERKRFSWSAMCDKIVELYNSL
ncbi:MAG: glycosyltransferase family 4 protein [Rikenellaceae bacterium]